MATGRHGGQTAAAGQQQLQGHALAKAAGRNPAQAVGDEAVSRPPGNLKARMVHVRHNGQRRRRGLAARDPGNDVPKFVEAMRDAQFLQDGDDRRSHARFVKGHRRVPAQPAQKIKRLTPFINHSHPHLPFFSVVSAISVFKS